MDPKTAISFSKPATLMLQLPRAFRSFRNWGKSCLVKVGPMGVSHRGSSQDVGQLWYVRIYIFLYSCDFVCVYLYNCIYIHIYTHRDTCMTLLFLGHQIVRQNLLGCMGNVQGFVPVSRVVSSLLNLILGTPQPKHAVDIIFHISVLVRCCISIFALATYPTFSDPFPTDRPKNFRFNPLPWLPRKSGPPFADVVMDAHLSHFNDGKAHWTIEVLGFFLEGLDSLVT